MYVANNVLFGRVRRLWLLLVAGYVPVWPMQIQGAFVRVLAHTEVRQYSVGIISMYPLHGRGWHAGGADGRGYDRVYCAGEVDVVEWSCRYVWEGG